MYLFFISSLSQVGPYRAQIALTSGDYLSVQKVRSEPVLDTIHQTAMMVTDRNSKQAAIDWAEGLFYTLVPEEGMNG